MRTLLELTTEALEREPHKGVRLEDPINPKGRAIPVNGLWTADDLRPRWENIAFLAHAPPAEDNIRDWSSRIEKWPVAGAVLAHRRQYYLLGRSRSGSIVPEQLALDEVRAAIANRRDEFLSRPRLASLRGGQLSFADLPVPLTKESLAFLSRHQAKLIGSLEGAITGAQERLEGRKSLKGKSRDELLGHTIRIAIAFAAARILEDKGFFNDKYDQPSDDPSELLKRTVNKTNGFFKKALEQSLPHVERYPDVLEQLAAHLGSAISFALVSHFDVGELYENMLRHLPKEQEGCPRDWKQWGDLQQHYTPVAIAQRMLEYLPLERLRPENRLVFDPAAGSGSLLLAASMRLSAMEDIPHAGRERQLYLETHVAGNDMDEFAEMVTRLRYSLVGASLYRDMKELPTPKYTRRNYEEFTADGLRREGRLPSVLVANPPYQQQGSTQRATEFVRRALSWLDDNGQFAFVLPKSFLGGSTRGADDVREAVAEDCQILDVWQLPEKVVGLRAQQAVTVVLGIKGRARRVGSIGRALLPRAQVFADKARESGFLGPAWLIPPRVLQRDWSAAQGAIPFLPEVHVPLNSCYELQIGATLNNGRHGLPKKPTNVPAMRFWKSSWRGEYRLWANPEHAPEDEQWIRCDEEWLKRIPNDGDVSWFKHPKLIVKNSSNADSEEPLAACLDTNGLLPNHKVLCIRARVEPLDRAPAGWATLSDEQRLLWLLGLLSSRIVVGFALSRQSGRDLPREALDKIPLPAEVDPRIVEWVRKAVRYEQANNAPIGSKERERLEELVKESYGLVQHEPLQARSKQALTDWAQSRRAETVTVMGQVLEQGMRERYQQVRLYLNAGFSNDEQEGWIALPQEMPGWALDGAVFFAELDTSIDSFQALSDNAWALRDFRHSPRPYLTIEELEQPPSAAAEA